jgi:cation:H+ antiporter
VPELATTLVSKLRGHDEVGLGTILGSNIFNGLLIVAVAAIICPIPIRWQEVAVAVAFGVLTVLATYPARGGFIERKRGFILLGLYAAYLLAIAKVQTP